MQGMQVAAGAAFAPPYATECAMTLTAPAQRTPANLRHNIGGVGPALKNEIIWIGEVIIKAMRSVINIMIYFHLPSEMVPQNLR